MGHSCNPSAAEGGAGGPEVQGHPWLMEEAQGQPVIPETMSERKEGKKEGRGEKGGRKKEKGEGRTAEWAAALRQGSLTVSAVPLFARHRTAAS